jgi:Domain of unknown function (DUF4402)
MMSVCIILNTPERILRVVVMSLFFYGILPVAFGQEAPPRPITVYVNPAQGLIFGAFTQGVTGGTVIIYPNGVRSTTGDILQLPSGIPFSPAIFEVEANVGTVVSIINGPDVQLSGSNGGSMMLQLGGSSTGSPFITTIPPPGRTEVRIGGTLFVGSPLANPGGEYSGTFMVTFIQE